ncbi:MAG: 16S rRNA (cytidine(1402)-2'-O)-methyltransferase, partial [Kiloniellales bacterium]|nr:16S rRNA (cytidine(1402)-2'-O)-methyltransferase [Kiloniellales bacterium]
MTSSSKSDTASGIPPNPRSPFKSESESNAPPDLRKEKARLEIVATPIGNLQDLTLRACERLKSVDLIACEDTRVTRKLLTAHNISTQLIAYHEHNAERVRPLIIEKLKSGQKVALVSDAGTPLISDPGYKLVQSVLEEGLEVTALPGPSAPLMALVVSGLPSDRFYFGGFLPVKTQARKKHLESLKGLRATLIFLESAKRLLKTLATLSEVFGARDAAVARELTKRFEEIKRG